jgi:hypothetical protein
MGKSKVTETEEVRQAKSKAKRMFIISFYMKEIVHKEFVLAGEQSIPHTTVTFYGDCDKMYNDFTLSCGNERTCWCIMTMHHFPSRNL